MNCKFALLRYTPDLVKGEFVNLGVAILDHGGGFLGSRTSGETEMRRLRCLHPDADFDLLTATGAAWSNGGMPWEQLESWRETLADSLTVTDPKTVITADWHAEMDALYRRYVAAPPRPREERTANPRGELRQRLHDRLLIAGLLDRLQPFPVDRFTVPGDSFKIDYAYVPATNGRRKYLHAVTLDRAMPQAARLALVFERIRRASTGDQLTALYDDHTVRHGATPIRGLLESSGIQVRPYGEIDSLVKEIRRDLAA
jgi:hypothetical protein